MKIRIVFLLICTLTLTHCYHREAIDKVPDDASKSRSTDISKLDSGSESLFGSCEEIQGYLADMRQQYVAMTEPGVGLVLPAAVTVGYAESNTGPDAISSDGNSVMAPAAQMQTNVQENSVDESDYVKYHEKAIFVARYKRVEVISLPNFGLQQSLEISDLGQIELLVQDNYLFVLGSAYNVNGSFSKIYVYNIALNDASEVTLTLVQTHQMEGQFEEARKLAKGILFIDHRYPSIGVPVSMAGGSDTMGLPPQLASANSSSAGGGATPMVEKTTRALTETQTYFEGIPCDHIIKKRINDYDFTITRLRFLSFADLKTIAAIGIMGGVNTVYVSEKNVYLVQNQYGWFGPIEPQPLPITTLDATFVLPPMNVEMLVRKIGLPGLLGEFSIGGSILLPGQVKDRWSLKEISKEDKDYLALATTEQNFSETRIGGFPSKSTNRFFIIAQAENSKPELGVVAHVGNYGNGEQIKAVRYIDNVAYIVTFQTIDPLHIIDFNNPLEPKMMAELKIDGFSAYLHPLAAKKLFGVGFWTKVVNQFTNIAGIQFSLFDVANLSAPKLLDVKTMDENIYQSEVLSDTRAFFYNPSTSLVAVPVSGYNNYLGEPYRVINQAVLFRVDAQLNEIGRIDHSDFKASYCYNYPMALSTTSGESMALGMPDYYWESSAVVNRFAEVDNNFVSISNSGIKIHNSANPTQVNKSISFTEIKLCN
jgi:uncharacterized secreted protein with C-terminal beta-propeller domain